MSEAENFGTIVVVHDQDPGTLAKGGEDVTSYELAEPWTYGPPEPHHLHDPELLAYHDHVVQNANGPEDWRVEEVLTCDCAGRGAVAFVQVHKSSLRRWVTAREERIPKAFRRVDSVAGPRGLPMHRGLHEENPCVVGVTSCRACSQRWLVLTFEDRAACVRIRWATHGKKLLP